MCPEIQYIRNKIEYKKSLVTSANSEKANIFRIQKEL